VIRAGGIMVIIIEVREKRRNDKRVGGIMIIIIEVREKRRRKKRIVSLKHTKF
jgi:hypothetical protein